MIGLQKAFFDPDPQYVTLVINLGWIVYNLMVLGAAMSVAVEEKEPHRFPRVELNLPIVLETSDGVRHAARTAEYSQKELRVRAVDTDFPALAAGDRVAFELAEETGAARFEGVVAEVADGRADIAVDLPDMAVERRWNSVTFSRRGHVGHEARRLGRRPLPDGLPDARPSCALRLPLHDRIPARPGSARRPGRRFLHAAEASGCEEILTANANENNMKHPTLIGTAAACLMAAAFAAPVWSAPTDGMKPVSQLQPSGAPTSRARAPKSCLS